MNETRLYVCSICVLVRINPELAKSDEYGAHLIMEHGFTK